MEIEEMNAKHLIGSTLEKNVEYIFKTAGFETTRNQIISKYEIDVLVKIGDRTIIIECKNYQNSTMIIRNLIHQWNSKNHLIKADKIILVLAGLNIKLEDYELANQFNIDIWNEDYLTDLFRLSLNPINLKRELINSIDLTLDVDIANLYRNEIKKLVIYPILKNEKEDLEEVYKHFNNWLRIRARTDLRMSMANVDEINNHIELFEGTKKRKFLHVFNINRGETEYWEELRSRLMNSSVLAEEIRKKYYEYMINLSEEYNAQKEYLQVENEEYIRRIINIQLSLLIEDNKDTCLLGTNRKEAVSITYIGDLQFEISLDFVDEERANIISWLLTSEYKLKENESNFSYVWKSTEIDDTSERVFRIFNEVIGLENKKLYNYLLLTVV